MPKIVLETEELVLPSPCQLEPINFAIAEGQFWAIMGNNGMGKSTLLKVLAGLTQSTSGKILIDERNVDDIPRKELARYIGVLFQEYEQPFPMPVLEQVLHGYYAQLGPWESLTKGHKEKAYERLQSTGLRGYENRLSSSLSGGEKRRLQVATLLTQSPLIYLLDEPTNHLDLHHQLTTMQIFHQQIDKYKKSAIAVLHDINLAARFATHLILFSPEGKVYSGPRQELLKPEILSEIFQYPIREIALEERSLYYPI